MSRVMERSNIYSFIEVDFGSNHKTTARPAVFTTKSDGTPIGIEEYHTTCPGCGSLVVIDVRESDLTDETILICKCSNCKYYKDDKSAVPSIQVERKIDPPKNIKNDSVSNSITKSIADHGKNIKVGGIKPIAKARVKLSEDGALVSDCPFVDPIELGLFKPDEI